jgi:hypothetical protein
MEKHCPSTGRRRTVTKIRVCHEDQWNRIEDPDMKPHNYNQLVFDKGAKNI